MKFHKLPHLTRDITGQHYRPVLSDVCLPRLRERRRQLKFRLNLETVVFVEGGKSGNQEVAVAHPSDWLFFTVSRLKCNFEVLVFGEGETLQRR